MRMQLPEEQVSMYSPLTLAYVGDGVYELLVRGHISKEENLPANKLHHRATSYVAAGYQSAYMELLLPRLTPQEEAVYKRGRNAKSHTMAKNSSVLDYKRATGLEALFGYLYLTGQEQRLEELFEVICQHHDEVVEEYRRERAQKG
ncbi:MAG: Mini-ribonuclease 3 [Eubacteriales bacterium]|jgi:ribonuclease-3 family protein